MYRIGLKVKSPARFAIRTSMNTSAASTMLISLTSNDLNDTISVSRRKDFADAPRSLSLAALEMVSDDDESDSEFYREPRYNDMQETPTVNFATHIQQRQDIELPHRIDEVDNVNVIAISAPQLEPKYSFHRRVLPVSLTQFSSPEGRELFRVSLSSQNAEAYFPLAEQFLSQSDPAFCGITSLVMVLNAMGVDPNVRWKGGWRWYGSEDMIFDSCCVDADRVKQEGISMEQFRGLGRCQGLSIELKRAFPIEDEYFEAGTNNIQTIPDEPDDDFFTVEDFRNDIIDMVQNPPVFEIDEENPQSIGGFMVVSFDRSSLGQTGEGHFSPIAAYHEETDQCLVLDVARFKYAPYWVPVADLYRATKPKDQVTNKSRGWFKIYADAQSHSGNRIVEGRESNVSTAYRGMKATSEAKRPAETVPTSGNVYAAKGCPVGEVKIQYCSVGRLPTLTQPKRRQHRVHAVHS